MDVTKILTDCWTNNMVDNNEDDMTGYKRENKSNDSYSKLM